jgi:hypothetical protein
LIEFEGRLLAAAHRAGERIGQLESLFNSIATCETQAPGASITNDW